MSGIHFTNLFVMDRSSAVEIITRTGWLSRQTKKTQEILLDAAELRHYEKGEYVYRLGEDSDGVYSLIDGELDVIVAPNEMPPLFVHVAQPGWWVGEAALITGTERRAGLMARTSSWLFRIKKADVEKLAATNPLLWRSLAEITVSHLDHALTLLVALSQKDPLTRVNAVLVYIASSSGLEQNVTVSLTHDQLGEMCRLGRHAVRKVLLSLQEEGLLEMGYGQITFPNPSLLKNNLNRLAAEDF